jgi:hypothetical protein
MDFFEMLKVLSRRPECEHNLNGPCKVCGPGLTLAETGRWQGELEDLGVAEPDQ